MANKGLFSVGYMSGLKIGNESPDFQVRTPVPGNANYEVATTIDRGKP